MISSHAQFGMASVLAVMVAWPGHAQPLPAAVLVDAGDADAGGPEGAIIVTGQRIARTVQETNASLDLTTADEIEAQAAPDRVEQLLQLVPNVTFGGGDQGPSIRGQESTGVLQGADAFLGGSRPRTTIQVDGRPLTYNEFVYGTAPIWDVNRVEVYRTPQTTTQGRNSIAGAIFIETNDPTYTTEGRVRVLAGEADTRQLSAVLSAPIVADQLAFRVAGDLRTSRSWSKLPDDVEGASPYSDDYGVLRAKLLAEPQGLPGARLELSYVHLESQSPQGETVRAPFKARSNPVGGGGVWRTNVDSVTGRFTFDLGGTLALDVTPTYGDTRIDRYAGPGNGRAVVLAEDVSVETLLRYGDATTTVSGVAGVYGFRSEQDETIDLSAFIGLGDFRDEQKSLGLFGEVTVRPLPALELTGGLRYQRDRQDRQGFLGTEAFGFTVDYDRTFDAWLPKLSAAYEVSPGFRIGALAQRAYNPGGTTISFETGQQDFFEDETLWTYEVFARTSWLDGALTLNGNLFYTDFRDTQRPITTLVTRPGGAQEVQTQIDNAPRARSYGAELELAWTATRRLNLRGAIGLLDTKIQEALDPADPIVGKNFQRAPKFTGAVAVDWRPVNPLRLSTQVRHNSRYFSDDANTRALVIRGSTTVDARAAYTVGRVTAFAYARNLFDDFALTQLYGTDFGTANDPRELGAGLEMRF